MIIYKSIECVSGCTKKLVSNTPEHVLFHTWRHRMTIREAARCIPLCVFVYVQRDSCASNIPQCAVSVTRQALLIFHRGYSWINAFKVLLKDQFHDLFRHKTVRRVAGDVRAMRKPRLNSFLLRKTWNLTALFLCTIRLPCGLKCAEAVYLENSRHFAGDRTPRHSETCREQREPIQDNSILLDFHRCQSGSQWKE